MTDQTSWITAARQSLKNSNTNYFAIEPLRYWTDFAISLILAYSAGSLFLTAPIGSLWQLVAFPFAVFWLYRLGSLVHEVCHLGQHEMRAFKVTWNLLAGVVMLSPSPFFTRHHRDHHSCKLYGTHEDPEYVVNFYGASGLVGVLRFAFEVAIFPLVVFLRFLLAPITFLHPRLREFALRHGTAMTLNWRYERDVNAWDRRVLTAIEILCSVRAALILLAVLVGWTDWTRLPLLYLLAVSVLALNQMRLLGDHHLASQGDRLTFDDHILDSCNYPRSDFGTWLLFPFAIRYHALHHMFPSLPYHNLSAAHAYLTRTLPIDSPYHILEQPSWWSVARHSFRNMEHRSHALPSSLGPHIT